MSSSLAGVVAVAPAPLVFGFGVVGELLRDDGLLLLESPSDPRRKTDAADARVGLSAGAGRGSVLGT